jgi:hypothetical protein
MAGKNVGLSKYLPPEILGRYEVLNYRNAAEILASSAKRERADLLAALSGFALTIADIRKPGGNESDIPKKLSAVLRPRGWNETRIKGDLHITKVTGKIPRGVESDDDADVTEQIETIDLGEMRRKGLPAEGIVRRNFLDGHKVDFVKGRVAFDVEWNSKDQTFDRDLYAFRAFYECDLIDVAVVLTRSADLNDVFSRLGPELDASGKPRLDKAGRPKLLKTKYGASTTWMGKLVYRLDAGRQGGCPVLALGITRRVITDWKD